MRGGDCHCLGARLRPMACAIFNLTARGHRAGPQERQLVSAVTKRRQRLCPITRVRRCGAVFVSSGVGTSGAEPSLRHHHGVVQRPVLG